MSVKLIASKIEFNRGEKTTFMLDYSSEWKFVIWYYFKTEKRKYNFF